MPRNAIFHSSHDSLSRDGIKVLRLQSEMELSADISSRFHDSFQAEAPSADLILGKYS